MAISFNGILTNDVHIPSTKPGYVIVNELPVKVGGGGLLSDIAGGGKGGTDTSLTGGTKGNPNTDFIPEIPTTDTPIRPDIPTTTTNTGGTPITESVCRLGTTGLALGEQSLNFNGSVVEYFNQTFNPFLNVVQSSPEFRVEAIRRLNAANPEKNFVFVNIGDKVTDKCAVLKMLRSVLPIPSTNQIQFVSYLFPQYGEYLYIGEDNALYRLEVHQKQMPTPPPGTSLGSGKVYTKIAMGDVLPTQSQFKTYGLWSANIGNLTTFFTSSAQNTASRLYHLEVRHEVDTSETSEVQFSIGYGHADGSGSYDLGGRDYYTPTKAVYGQYRTVCLDDTQHFTIANEIVKSVYIVNFRRARMGDRLDEGNFEINLHHLSGSEYMAGGGDRNAFTGSNIKLSGNDNVLRLIDDSKINSGSASGAGDIYQIISGTLEGGAYTPATPVVYGLVYPQLGVCVLNANKLDADAGFLTVTGSEVSASNAHQMLTAMSGAALLTDTSGDYLGFQARKIKQIYTNYYFVRVKNHDYNFSNNPSYTTGSNGDVHPNFTGDPKTYITSIGLYNERKELLAVSKVSKAILKTPVDEALFKVQLKYE